MSTFNYPMPESDPSSGFEGLSDEAKTALTGIEDGQSQASQLLGPDAALQGLDAEAEKNWAKEEFEEALADWSQYRNIGILDLPDNFEELAKQTPDIPQNIHRLYKAKQALITSGELTPEGVNVGDTMHLTLVPWRAIQANLNRFDDWLKELRTTQGIGQEDYINDSLLDAIKSDQPLYRYERNDPTNLFRPSEYLDQKIKNDGPWGVMLMQTSNDAGTESLIGQSPDGMTEQGAKYLKLAGHEIDNMGIFEWIALTLQKDPSLLSSQDYSWLLANRLEVDGGSLVPDGRWYDGQVNSGRYWSDYQYGGARPRLAVI